MRSFGLLMAAACFCVCCGASSSNGKQTEKEPTAQVIEEESESQAGLEKAGRTASKQEGTPDIRLAIAGAWENSSCGERQYLRRIELLDDESFTAVDEVAPCPPKKQCVWSGIIRWRGSYKLEGENVNLEIVPQKGEKTPENMPDSYVVLSADPISIGERIGNQICPYTKVK